MEIKGRNQADHYTGHLRGDDRKVEVDELSVRQQAVPATREANHLTKRDQFVERFRMKALGKRLAGAEYTVVKAKVT